MAQRQTEHRHPDANGLDVLDEQKILALLARGQRDAAGSVTHDLAAIARAAALTAASIAAGGRLIYAAAGSSGLMALADALELPGTYGIDPAQIKVLFAGGQSALTHMIGGPEDDEVEAIRGIEALSPTPRDTLITVSASGSTPFPMAATRAAKRGGAKAVAIANNADAALFGISDVAIYLPTPPEVIAGSTRMGAGTAQKITLNMISTLMAVRLGHVHDGYMVNVVADNAKLRGRAKSIVTAITGADDDTATRALTTSNGQVKLAVLLAAGATDVETAKTLLNKHEGRLRPALAELGMT